MKRISFTTETIEKLLVQETSTEPLRNPTLESFQEHQHHLLQHLRTGFLQTLRQIAEQNNTKTNIFTNLINNPLATTSLLAFGKQINPILRQHSHITISHNQSHSQSLLLALLKAKLQKQSIELIASDYQIQTVSRIVSEPNEADRVGSTKENSIKEGINFYSINDWNQISFQPDNIVIVDLFGLNPIQYRPFLHRYLSTLQKVKEVVLYHSHLQQQEVAHQLSDFALTWLPVSICPDFPLETILEKDEKAMMTRLISFLKEDSDRPEKQDIVIFYPPDIHIRKFAGKLGQLFSKEHLKSQVNIISKPFSPQQIDKNNIFIVKSAKQLSNWDYDFSRLFYVIDYKSETDFRYDYGLGTHVQYLNSSSSVETARRISFVNSNRIGRYASLSLKVSKTLSYLDSAQELARYALKMIYFEVANKLETGNKRLAACLQLMQYIEIIKKQNTTWIIKDKKIVEVSKQGFSPIEAKLVLEIMEDSSLKDQQKSRLSNLIIATLVILHSEGNLRQGKQQIESAAHIKPNGIWRKSGYLESCLQILTKYQLIQQRKQKQNSQSQNFRRKTSKFNQYQYDVFGSLFQIIEPKKKGFEEMEVEDFLRQCTANEELIMKIREEIFDFRDALNIQRVNIIFDYDDLTSVLTKYLKKNTVPVSLYSGSRREGYRMPPLTSIFPDKKSLMSQLNQRPECVFVMRLSCSEGRYQILMGNGFTTEVYMQIFGKLPVRRSESQSEMQVQFHGISSSTFEQLWKNNADIIVRFEAENECFVQPNQEMAMIMIHCRKQRQSKIKGSFESILAKIRQKVSMSNKLVHYLGTTNILLGAGGVVQQILQSNYIDKCILGNLHVEVTEEDLQQLFQDLFVLKKIQIQPPEPGKFCKSALISFNSQRDYYVFKECFNQCLYFDRLMEVKPVFEENKHLAIRNKQYIQFKWFVWKSHKKALVKFGTVEEALKALNEMKKYPQLDGAEVIVSCQGKELLIQNLKQYTDEICVDEAMRGFGMVKEVQILKTPLKEISGDDIYIESLIKEINLKNNQGGVQFKMEAIEKGKNGLRICRVHMNDLDSMNRVSAELNKVVGKMGEGRLYAQTWFETPVLVPHNSLGIYQEVLAEVLAEGEVNSLTTFLVEDEKRTYIVLKCPIKQILDTFHQKLMGSLKGYLVPLSDYEKTVILSEIGLANLLDLEEKYHCKLIVDQIARTLHTLVSSTSKKTLHQQIKARVEDHFFYRLSLNRKTFKHLKNNQEKIQEIKSTYNLQLIEVESDSMALLLQGSALNVQKAFNYLMHLIESLTKVDEELINADVCGICCSEPHRPYRLQACSHKFCRSCLLDYISTVLGDNAMFPIKCPQCMIEIVIDDLDSILDNTQWAKVMTMATNQYLAKKADVMTFCFTAGCKQINMIKSDHIQCDVCLSTYCLECKGKYHPGLTCQQAKQGGDEAFKKYMKENGIRQCPNQKCKIPVVRIDGCYRVTCSRCQKSMCFKCQPDKMIAYDDYNACYKHLNDVHGGYW